jgi:hypothetical protein
MNGLELSRAFFAEFGMPMLEREFPDQLPLLAAGLFGSGSECFGYDDSVSRDHDFEPGFCLFLPDESIVSRRTAFLLERAYAKLPREYLGVRREILSPVGGARRGVLRISEFFSDKVGSPDGVLSLEQWLSIPENALAEATNGLIFFDAYGLVTEIRKRLSSFPEDVLRKRVAGNLLLMAQAGQYNYRRCLSHGELAAAQLAIVEFVESAMSAVFLLNRKYQPFYKWRFRAFRELPLLGDLADTFSFLLCSGNEDIIQAEKENMISEISLAVSSLLYEQELTGIPDPDLETQAYEVNNRIKDPNLRNSHILSAV